MWKKFETRKLKKEWPVCEATMIAMEILRIDNGAGEVVVEGNGGRKVCAKGVYVFDLIILTSKIQINQ